MEYRWLTRNVVKVTNFEKSLSWNYCQKIEKQPRDFSISTMSQEIIHFKFTKKTGREYIYIRFLKKIL